MITVSLNEWQRTARFCASRNNAIEFFCYVLCDEDEPGSDASKNVSINLFQEEFPAPREVSVSMADVGELIAALEWLRAGPLTRLALEASNPRQYTRSTAGAAEPLA